MPPKRGFFGTLSPGPNPYLPMASVYRQGIPNPYSLRAHHTRLPVFQPARPCIPPLLRPKPGLASGGGGGRRAGGQTTRAQTMADGDNRPRPRRRRRRPPWELADAREGR